MRPALRAALTSLALGAASAPRAIAEPVPAAPGVHPTTGEARWLTPPVRSGPRRVVSLTPCLTDVVVALGLRDRLVGVTRFDHAPEVARLARVGGYVDPNPEVILGLEPDLVLWAISDASAAAVRKVAELQRRAARPIGILTVPAETLGDALAAPVTVGEALGAPEAGRTVQAAMAAAIARFRERAGRLPHRRFLFLVGRQPLVAAGPGSFPDELLRAAGFENVVTRGPPWSDFPLERAVAEDPDLLIDASHHEPETSLPRLALIPAVRRGRRVALRSDDMLRPGPRLIPGLEELFHGLDEVRP